MSQNGMVQPCPAPPAIEAGKGRQRQGARHVSEPPSSIAAIGIDIGKNSFHVVGLDARGSILLRQKWSRGQVEARLANMPPCLIGMEACVGAHHLSRKLKAFGHDARLMPLNTCGRTRRDRRITSAMPRQSPRRSSAPR